VTAGTLLDLLRREYNVEAQGGQAHLADRLVRVGHMGWVHEPEMRQAVAAIADATARLAQGVTASDAAVNGAAETITA
jgi:aspartate aminotransferase-like enzyme